MLPSAPLFDGPMIAPDAILDCFAHSSLPTMALGGGRGGRKGSYTKEYTLTHAPRRLARKGAPIAC